jgi:sulfatase maturation enzyme AslB (radical SAM superfamily)
MRARKYIGNSLSSRHGKGYDVRVHPKLRTILSAVNSVIGCGLFKISFSVTYLCNLKCKNCNIWCKYQESPEKIAEELEPNEYIKIFSKLPKSLSIIEFTGGEPFLKKDFDEIIIWALRLLRPYRIYIPTNGFLTKRIENVVRKVLSSDEWKKSTSELIIGTSIDGFKEIHDYLRGVQGAYHRAWKTFDTLWEMSQTEPRLKCFVSTTLFNDNLRGGEVFKFIRALQNKHIPYGLNNCNYSEYYNLRQSEWCRLDALTFIKTIKKEIIPNYASNISSKYYWYKAIEFLENPRKLVLPCPALKMFCAVDPYGNVWPCLMWPRTIANLRYYNYDIEDLYRANRDEVGKIARLINDRRCPNCWTPCTSGQRILYTLLSRPWKLLNDVVIMSIMVDR